jgi:hypothetical protein
MTGQDIDKDGFLRGKKGHQKPVHRERREVFDREILV